MTEIERRLLEIAANYEHKHTVEFCLYKNSDDLPLGGYWVNDLPDSVLELWDRLSLESKLAMAVSRNGILIGGTASGSTDE